MASSKLLRNEDLLYQDVSRVEDLSIDSTMSVFHGPRKPGLCLHFAKLCGSFDQGLYYAKTLPLVTVVDIIHRKTF